MSVFNKVKKWYNNNFDTCPICNKNTITKSEKCCKTCKEKLALDTKYAFDNINRFRHDIKRGYKKIEPYLTRYQLILDEFKNVYDIRTYIEDKLTLEPKTYEELENICYDEIKKIINEKKEILFHQFKITGEAKFYNELKKLRNEILELQIKFPQFIVCLDISDLQPLFEKK